MNRLYKLLIPLVLSAFDVASAQIGVTESQLVKRWKGGTVDLEKKTISFPHGNNGCGVTLEYLLGPAGVIKFEQWWSDCGLSPAEVLKQSEPGYTWYRKDKDKDSNNWFGYAKNKPDLHAFYHNARAFHAVDIAMLADAPDRGEGGLELMDLEDLLSGAVKSE
jgi:hypothetical protein